MSVGIGADAGPAYAVNRLGLSWDGTTWTSSLTGQLFDEPRLWVPGDTSSGRFFVRNQSGDRATLHLQYDLPTSALIASHNVTLTARVAGGDWTSLPDGDGWLSLDPAAVMPRSSVPVDVRGEFAASSGNASQQLREPIGFRVTLVGTSTTQAGSPSPGNPGTSTGQPGHHDSVGVLPGTGSPVRKWMLGVAAALIGAGLALVRWSRPRRSRGGASDGESA